MCLISLSLSFISLLQLTVYDNKSASAEPGERKKSISQLLTADFLTFRNNSSDPVTRRSSVSLKESTFGMINKLIRGYSTDNDQPLTTIDKKTQMKWPPEKATLALEQIREDNGKGVTFPIRRELSYNQIRCSDFAVEPAPEKELVAAEVKRHTSLKQRRQSFFSRPKRTSISEEQSNQDSSCPIYAKKNVVLRRKSVFASMAPSTSGADCHEPVASVWPISTRPKTELVESMAVLSEAGPSERPSSIALCTPAKATPIAGVTAPMLSLSPTSVTGRKNSVFHEIRVLSPRNSLSGVFYSSSVISVKNSNSNEDGLNLCDAQKESSGKNGYVQRVKRNGEFDRIRKFCIYFKWTTWMSEREEHSLFLFSKDNSVRQYCLWLADHPYFDYVVLIFISLNCITLAMERPKIPPWSRERDFLSFANYVFTIVFGIEMLIKVVAKGLFYGKDAYFHNGWNIMDGSLVGISLFDIFLSFFAQRSPRIFGILRVFRLLRSLRPLR